MLDAVLASLSGPLSTAELRITPLAVEAPGALGGPFSILKFSDPHEQDIVYLEGREGATYLEARGDVLRHEQIFSRLPLLTPANRTLVARDQASCTT